MRIFELITENYEWIFSGIGVTVLIWLLNSIGKYYKKSARYIHKILRKLQKKNIHVPPKYMTITTENGDEERVEVILSFEFTDNKREYVIYTEGELDEYGNTTIYVNEVIRENGAVRLDEVTDREWKRVRRVLIELSNSKVPRDQPYYDKNGIQII